MKTTKPMTWKELKTVEVEAAEHYDGLNRYFSGIITLIAKDGTKETIEMRFQYGYGSQWEYKAGCMVKDRFPRTKFAKESCPLWGINDRYGKELNKNFITGKSERYCKNLVK